MKRTLISAIAVLALTSCDNFDIAGMFYGQSEEVNKRFEYYSQWNEDHPIDDVNAGSDSYSFFLVADIHSEGQCKNLETFVSTCLASTDAEHLILCLGDLISTKAGFNSVWDRLKPIEDEPSWKIFPTIGNHDLYFNLWPQYREHWPTSSYTFKVHTPSAGTDFYISVDSAEGTIGTEQRKWLENVLEEAQSSQYRNIVVFTHTNFFKRDLSQGLSGNFTFEESADLMALFSKYKVKYVLTGHDHYFEDTTFRGVRYLSLNALVNKPGSFYLMTIGDGLSWLDINTE